MSTIDHPAARPPRRVHPWNLAFGLLFLAVAATWAALENDVVEGYEVGRIFAWALIGLGVVGIAGTLLVTRRGAPAPRAAHGDPDADPDSPADSGTPDPTEGDPL